MRVVKWLTGLLYQLSLFITRSWEVHFHPRQEALVRTLASYEVVTPARVNEFGEVFPQSHHFSRRKRSSETLEPTPFRTHYRIRAYGQLFQLNLSADAAFLAAGYTEVHLGTSAHPAEERSAAPADLRHCFYRGQVNAREDHTAVFSLCGGLMGTFKAHDGEYFLEPIMKADGSEHEDDHSKPHLIYRQELKGNYFLQSHKPCDASESEIKKTTLPFHNYSDINENLNIKEERVLGYTSKNISLEDERSQLHSRKKRFLSYPRYVEVMVTADSKMVHHHGQNLQHYVLTLMSIYQLEDIVMYLVKLSMGVLKPEFMNDKVNLLPSWKVAAIYKDSSIGNLINIVIVKLVIIHDEQEGPVISFNAATTLRNFCLWQQTQNVLDDAHPSHHDTAVLITREDICGAREKCDTLGLAELGTLCDPLRSCSISEENGLSAAFTIAHELGHVFNVPHDDSFKCKETGIKHQYHVMAPTLNYHTSPWTWSKCSQKYITEFLEPRNGGKYCVGRRMKFRSCNTDSCPKGKQDFREKQCSDFDGKHFNINGLSPNVRWLPKYSGIAVKDRCKLYCRVAGTTSFYQLKDRVADGTPCGTETNDICVQGLCRQAGCDHVLNSKARRDKCGVCGGDNSSCRTMAGVFNSAHYGYNVVVKIPPGATNIDILQHSYSGKPEDDNYLALSDTQGNFLLNGNFVVSMSKREINVQGAIFEYSGSNNSIERINSTDRLEEELVLQCLVTCGKGTKQRQVWCHLNEDHLSDGFCDPSTKPESQRPCELHACTSWQVGPWGSCTATCGQGYQMRAVKCVNELFSTVLDDRLCHGASRPSERQCSVSCGRGNQARYVSCRDAHDGIADESFCAHLPRPAEIAVCFSPCGEWQTGNWSPCSSSCAGGVQRRVVVCQDENGQSASYCDAASKPPESKHCDSGPCPQWNYGSWGECTQTCGGGIKSRFVICQFPDGQLSQEQNCEMLNKPPSVVQCHIHACPDDVSWHRGPWKSWVCVTCEYTKCSVTCGSGVQRRDVYCRLRGVGRVAEEKCDPSTRPYFQRECWHRDCIQYHWAAGEWLDCSVSCKKRETYRQVKCMDAQNIQCSVTCGVGMMERRVECMADNGLSSDLCLKHLKPDAQKKCYVSDCKTFMSCKEIQVKNNITKDGDYYLNIKGRITKIYCAGMHLENPKEYISLVKGEEDNFSEVYGFRLQNPYECPFNGSRRHDCECKNDYLAAGHTVFSKIRIDLTSMQIKTTDLLFAQTIFGNAVPFATAGDCYSAARCPQDAHEESVTA
ncbi:hypothetical protein MJG53_004511 [Ovis ammon polii x Ovis aries]|uniref:Uncharacterized protein n=1 Tax=Ovis ammon polii x Ovis aries TaxID=2918886 RepID=A0ACB9VAE2_9CETA|nr:hypothetical protein MJG53_004511 [Ovis ammon polii x Ovis aries]